MTPLFRPLWCCARSCSFSRTRILALGCLLPTASAVANPMIPPPMIAYSCMDRVQADEFIAGLPLGSIRCCEEHFPAIKRLRMAAGRVTFHPPQAHEGEKRVFLEPALVVLRLKGL